MTYLPKQVFELYLPKKAKIINTGATSVIYKHKQKNMVYGITTDSFKIQWLEYNKERFNFKILKKENYINGGEVYFYEMTKLQQLSKKEISYTQKDVFDITRKIYTNMPFVGLKEIKHINKFIYSEWFKNELLEVRRCFGTKSKTLELDLHPGQVMKLKNKLVIIDPVYDATRVSDCQDN